MRLASLLLPHLVAPSIFGSFLALVAVMDVEVGPGFQRPSDVRREKLTELRVAATPGALDEPPDGSRRMLHFAGDGFVPSGSAATCTTTLTQLCTPWFLEYENGVLYLRAEDDRGLDSKTWRYEFRAPRSVSRDVMSPFGFPDSPNQAEGCDGVGKYCFRSQILNPSNGDRFVRVTRTRVATGEQAIVYEYTAGNGMLAVDGAGNLYVDEYVAPGDDGVRRISTDGVVSWVVGGNVASRSRQYGVDPNRWDLSNHYGLAFDSQGNLYLTEANRGLVLQATGVGDMAPPVPDPQTFGPCEQQGAATQVSVCRSDPVNTATGSFVTQALDLQMGGGAGQLTVERFYNSADFTPGLFGPGWTFSYGASLTAPSGPLASASRLVFRSETGQQLGFTRGADGAVVPDPGGRASLTAGSDSYAVTMRHGRRYDFDGSGGLTGVHDRNGLGATLVRGSGGALTGIVDSYGRVATVTTNLDGTIGRIELPDGRATSYDYAAGRLSAVHDAAGGITSYEYGGNGKIERIVNPSGHTTVRLVYDTNGRVREEYDALGNRTTFGWDPATETSTMTDAGGAEWADLYDGNVLKASIDPLGNTTAYRYDRDLNMIAVQRPSEPAPPPSADDPVGPLVAWVNSLLAAPQTAAQHITTYSYDSRGNLVRAQAPDPLGYVETRTYNSLDQVLTVTDGRANTTTFTYDTAGNLTSEAAPGRPPTVYERGPAGRLLSVTTPSGHKTTLTYDNAGNLTAETDPLGNRTTFAYDATGRRTARANPEGNRAGQTPAAHTTTWTYTPLDQKATETDPLGATTRWRYDLARNLTRVEHPGGGVTTHEYNVANERTATIDPDNRRTTWTYDGRGQPSSMTTAEGRTTTWTYDPARRVRTVTGLAGNATGADPATARWTYDYDAYGNRTAVTDPAGGRTATSYDVLNRPVRRTDPLGRVTTYEYDATSNPTAAIDPTGARTTLAYNPAGWLISSADPLNRTTTYGHDLDGHRTRQTSPLGNVTSWTYDGAGRLVSQTDPRGNVIGATAGDHTIMFGYDANGRRTSLTEPTGGSTTVTYDAAGRPLTVTEPGSGVTAYAYDPAGRVSKTTDALSASTTFDHSPGGDLLTRTDPKGRLTRRTYDGDHQLRTDTTPEGRVTDYTYDQGGRLSRILAPGDVATTYTYDRVDRVLKVDYSDATPDVSYTYDTAGQLTTITDGTGQRTRTYNPAGRLTSEEHDAVDRITYAYDAAGQITARGFSLTHQITYAYDADGRLQNVDTNVGDPTSFVYDPAGNVVLTQLPDGYQEQLSYDNANRISGVTHTRAGVALNQLSVARDPAGRPTRITGSPTPEQYSYDNLGQITQACYADPCAAASPKIAYTYDAVGNRTTETRDGTSTQTFTYNRDDELLQMSGPSGSRTAQHDPRGNLTKLGSDTYTYDAENRLTKVTTPSAVSTYRYDAEGNRVATTTANPLGLGTTTNHRWDQTQGIPQIAWSGATAAPSQVHLYGPRGRLLTAEGNQSTYHLHDALGSVITTTDGPQVKWRNTAYEPFGAQRATTQSLVPPSKEFGFVDEQQDPANGLYNLRARTYNPATGLFLGRDPRPVVPDAPGRSSYLYANNRPTQYVDPTGQREQLNQLTPDCTVAFYGAYYDIFTFGLASKLFHGIGHLMGLKPEQETGCTMLGKVGGAVGATVLAGAQLGTSTSRLTWTYDDALAAPNTVLSTPSVGSTKLQNIVNDLYKGTTNPGRIGTGTTVDALRYELSTGQRVFGKSHLQKAEDSLRGLENWLKANPNAPYHDRLVARSLADDLLDALGRAP